MFDLKKRNSLTLNCGREAEEFRRVAVRRRVKGAAGECVTSRSVVSGGLCGSYSCGRASSGDCGSEPDCKPGLEDDHERTAEASPLKPQVPPKPAHLQSPLRTGLVLSPSRGPGLCVSCVSPVHCLSSPSPIRGGANISPVRHTQGVPCITSSPLLGSPSPLRDGGRSPAKLSPRSHSPLSGLLRTPSPVQGRRGSYSPSRSSRSWLGLHRIPSSKMDKGEKRAGMSLSVPDLTAYLDDSRTETAEPSQSISAKAPGIRLNRAASEASLSSDSKDASPSQKDKKTGEGEEPAACGCSSSCRLNEAQRCRIQVSKSDEDQRKETAGGEENNEQKLFNVAKELLHTERTYVARLHLLDQVFCSRLTEEAGRGSFPPDVIKNIFSNISSIYFFHSKFLLPDLESCISHWCERPGLGTVVLQHAPFLRMYADYVRNFDQAMGLVRTWTERSSAFRGIVQDIQSREVCGSLTLQHHMLEPVQRVPRYELLLRDYLKKLPKHDPDYDLAHKALQTVSMAASHSNSAVHQAESLKRLLEIYEMVGEKEVVNPTNEFLREGRILKLAARNTSAMERHLFLFNNFLLCCAPKFSLVGQRFAVRCRIGVDGMQVQQTVNEDRPYSFQVSGKERSLELQASSESERDDWLKVIQEAVDTFQLKNETFKLASKELSAEEPAAELGRRAPRWIRDNEVTLCMKCQDPFNALTRRRHHCRACGCVVCWRCSDYKVALEYDGNKLNKVCKSCYSILIGQRAERAEGKKRRMLESEPSSDCVMSGFLLYGDNPNTWQHVWSVIPRTESPVLHLYPAPQHVKPLSSIPLLGCSVEDSPQELQGQPAFCLRRSRTSHTFSCTDLDLKHSWLAVLKVAVTSRSSSPSGPGCGGDGSVDDESVSSGEENNN